MKVVFKRWLPHAGLIATLIFVAALAGFAAALNGYSQVMHPVELLGATGMPRALAFNLMGLVLPGLLAGVIAMSLRQKLPATSAWPLRIGCQLVFLSALGFIALGLLPMDAHDINSSPSRLHATAWMLWWVAFVPGAGLLAFGLRAWPQAWKLVLASRIAAMGVLVMVLFAVAWLPGGIAQRLAFGLWFAWLCVAAWQPRIGDSE